MNTYIHMHTAWRTNSDSKKKNEFLLFLIRSIRISFYISSPYYKKVHTNGISSRRLIP